MKYLLLSVAIWNLIVFFTYGTDKLKAKKEARRISERTLLTLAFAAGGFGAMFGMVVFNHKTSKVRFRILVPLFTIVNGAALWMATAYIF